RTASLAGTVIVGSAIDFSARAARDEVRRDDPTWARAVVPAAEAALARVFLPLDDRPPVPVSPLLARPPLARPAVLPPLVVLRRFDPLVVATARPSSPAADSLSPAAPICRVYPQVPMP